MKKVDFQKFMQSRISRFIGLKIVSWGKHSGKVSVQLHLTSSLSGNLFIKNLVTIKGTIECEKALKLLEKYERWYKELL